MPRVDGSVVTMSMLPAAAAVEADRLVLGVNRARDRDRITRDAAAVGLEDWHLLGHWWDFLLAGKLTREVARLRTRYWPSEDVDTMLDRLLGGGLVREHAGGLLATSQLAPVLHAIRDESARVARDAWAGHPDLVEVVNAGATRMAAAAGDDAPVVVAHRAIPLPDRGWTEPSRSDRGGDPGTIRTHLPRSRRGRVPVPRRHPGVADANRVRGTRHAGSLARRRT